MGDSPTLGGVEIRFQFSYYEKMQKRLLLFRTTALWLLILNNMLEKVSTLQMNF